MYIYIYNGLDVYLACGLWPMWVQFPNIQPVVLFHSSAIFFPNPLLSVLDYFDYPPFPFPSFTWPLLFPSPAFQHAFVPHILQAIPGTPSPSTLGLHSAFPRSGPTTASMSPSTSGPQLPLESSWRTWGANSGSSGGLTCGWNSTVSGFSSRPGEGTGGTDGPWEDQGRLKLG